MNQITQKVGTRIRVYRQRQFLTQEELAERAGLHNTYIGQIERGEKNLSINSLDKILYALNLSYSEFFEPMDLEKKAAKPAAQCYELISRKSEPDQKRILHILQEIDAIIDS